MYLADAHKIKDISDKCKNNKPLNNKRLSKNAILNETYPFSCLFCCLKTQGNVVSFVLDVLTEYKNFDHKQGLVHDNEHLPNYVNLLLDSGIEGIDGIDGIDGIEGIEEIEDRVFNSYREHIISEYTEYVESERHEDSDSQDSEPRDLVNIRNIAVIDMRDEEGKKESDHLTPPRISKTFGLR